MEMDRKADEGKRRLKDWILGMGIRIEYGMKGEMEIEEGRENEGRMCPR